MTQCIFKRPLGLPTWGEAHRNTTKIVEHATSAAFRETQRVPLFRAAGEGHFEGCLGFLGFWPAEPPEWEEAHKSTKIVESAALLFFQKVHGFFESASSALFRDASFAG